MTYEWFPAACGLALAPACGAMGLAAQKMKLPQITGYLVAGVIVGPYMLGLITHLSVGKLWMVDQACLSLIAFAAGAELHLGELESMKKQVLLITLCVSAASWAVTFVALIALAPLAPVLHAFSTPELLVFCSLFAVLMAARSPASAIAVLQETSGKGSFCSLVMAVIVVKDVLVIVAFALNIEAARSVFSHSAAGSPGLALHRVLEPFVSVAAAVTIGLVAGCAIPLLLRGVGQCCRAGPGVRSPARYVALALLAMTTFATATVFEAEPLLACSAAGLVANNIIPEREREELMHSLEAMMPAVNLAFFALAGASLKVTALVHSILLGSLIVTVRLMAVYIGSSVGCWASSTPPDHRRRMWQAMVTQAGVALGLARMTAARFPTWGPHFQTLATSVIVLNLMIGPPLFRHAIIATGESRTAGSHKADVDLSKWEVPTWQGKGEIGHVSGHVVTVS